MPTTTITYAVQHPAMSEALLIEASEHRTEAGIIATAAMHILRQHDEMLDVDEWMIWPVPADTVQGYSIFVTEPA